MTIDISMMRHMNRSKKNFRTGVALLCALFLISVCSLEAETSRWDRAGAQRAFLEAESLHRKLSDNPESPLSEYLRCARMYRRVYFKDPHYRHAAEAIYSEGLVYEKMADISDDSSYRRMAIKRFEFLVSDYGGNRNCKDARSRIRALKAHSRSSADEGTPETASNELIVAGKMPQQIDVKHSATVLDVRHTVSEEGSRLSIYLDSPADFKREQVRDPDRIYFDIANADLSEDLRGSVIPVQDPFLKQVRIGQFRPDVVRVVLDLTSFPAYSVYSLEDPARIVVDLNHDKAKARKVEQPVLQPDGEAKSAESPVQEIPPEIAKTGPAEPLPVEDPAKDPRSAASLSLAGKTVPLDGILHRDSPDPPRASEPTALGSRSLTRVLGLKIGKIVIDPGHGGHDLGTVGPSGLLEKDLVLKLSIRLKRMLEERLAADVILTRERDVFVSLEERTDAANRNKADVFISIHANSSRNKRTSGVETYYLDFAKTETERTVAARENAGTGSSIHELEAIVSEIARADKATESEELATLIQNSLYEKARNVFSSTQNRGVRSAPFIVLIGAKMPSILTEVAFISNPRDERELNKEENLDQLAEALFQGIETYMKKLGNYPIAYRTAPNK